MESIILLVRERLASDRGRWGAAPGLFSFLNFFGGYNVEGFQESTATEANASTKGW